MTFLRFSCPPICVAQILHPLATTISHPQKLCMHLFVVVAILHYACALILPWRSLPVLSKAVDPPVPFPKWLSDFTGLTQWPGLDPPYIPLEFINFAQVPAVPQHAQAQCATLYRDSCSFDCFNCISFDDVYTCPQLSQTFDDGPSPATVKLLEQINTKSTFFTLGVQVVQYPSIYRQIVERGHVIGSHTWSHKFLPGLSNEEIVAQIEWSIWAMNATGGHIPKWFRPPYGGVDNRVRSIVRQFGMQSVLWNFDTFDWKLLDLAYGRDEKEIYRDVAKFREANNNQGLILEHDAVMRTVNIGIEVNKILGPSQLTVPQCVGGIDYIKRFN